MVFIVSLIVGYVISTIKLNNWIQTFRSPPKFRYVFFYNVIMAVAAASVLVATEVKTIDIAGRAVLLIGYTLAYLVLLTWFDYMLRRKP